MLKSSRRVSKTIFKSLNRPYKTINGEYFLLRIFKINTGPSKFAVSISKSREKKAVLRNKMRRLAYSSIGNLLNQIKDGFVFHFLLNKKPKDLKHDINKDITNCLNDFLL